MELDHGAAIVTGAAGGIGAATVRRLVSGGMAVVAADLDPGRLDALVEAVAGESIGARVGGVVGDVGDVDHHAELVAAARDLGAGEGGLRLSVLNAGLSLGGFSWELPLAEWELQVRVNYWGVVHGLRAALEEMVPADDGWVVAVSSGAGLVATPGLAPYVSTKHAVVGVMESAHHELARIGSAVGTSVVCPGSIATGMPDRSASVLERMTGTAPAPDSSAGTSDSAGSGAAATSAGDAGPGAPGSADGPDPAARIAGGGPGSAADVAGGRRSTAEVAAELAATTRAGVEGGAAPETVSDAIAAAVESGTFWVLPQPELGWAAHDRMKRVMEGDAPVDLLG